MTLHGEQVIGVSTFEMTEDGDRSPGTEVLEGRRFMR